MAKPKKTVSKSEADKTTADQTPSVADKATSEAKASASETGASTDNSGNDVKPGIDKPEVAKPEVGKTDLGQTDSTTPKPADTDPSKPTAASATPKSEEKAEPLKAGATSPDPKKPEKDVKPHSNAASGKDTKTAPAAAMDDPKTRSGVTPPKDKPSSDPAPSRASAAATNTSANTSKPTSGKPEKSTSATSTPKPTPAPEPAPKERKRSVFFPMVLGGVIAAGLGFAASEYDVLGTRAQSAAELQSAMEAQQARIADLEARAEEPAALPESLPQVDALSEELSAAREELAAAREEFSALQSQLAELDSRLTTVEKQPVSGGENEVAIAAFEREMEALRASVAEQRSEVESLLDNAQSAEEATAAAAVSARAQTAMTQVNTAISAGRPYEAALAELQAVRVEDIPQPLTDTATGGVVTLANLQARYPDAARQALATARAAVPDDGEGSFGSFLKRQLGARSVAPRDGADPDAVLSRAEAAVRDGRLTDALAEIDTLPAPAQDAMAEWLVDARARQAAETAADELSQRLTAN